MEQVNKLEEARQNKGLAFVGMYKRSPVFRDFNVKLHYEDQIKLYTLCECGSGKKYKWCSKEIHKKLGNK